MEELSLYLGNTVRALQTDYPALNIVEYTPMVEDESVTSNIEVVVGIVEAAMGPADGTANLVVTATVQADVNWKFVDVNSHQIGHPLDVATSLLSWAFNRYVEPANSVTRPVGVTRVVLADPFGEEDRSRTQYLVQWQADIAVVPNIDVQGPAEVGDFGGPAVDLNELVLESFGVEEPHVIERNVPGGVC